MQPLPFFFLTLYICTVDESVNKIKKIAQTYIMLPISNLCFWIYIASVFIALLFSHLFFGLYLKLYDKTRCFDLSIHALSSGLLYTVLGFFISYQFLKQPVWFAAIFAFCATVTIGAIWEIAEFLADGMFGTNMQRWKDKTTSPRGAGLMDIMGDMVATAVGSFVVSILLIIIALLL